MSAGPQEVLDDLDTLLEAAEELAANQEDADAETLEEAATVMEKALDAGADAIESGEVPEDSEPVETLQEGARALREVAEGDAAEEVVEEALDYTRTFHEKLTLATVKALLG